MVIVFLATLITLLLIYGRWEYQRHERTLAGIPLRIHVNGSRGKSSVTRLISAGLRAGGLKTLSKTTGSAPRVIEMDGTDRIIHRLRSASIGEQVKLLRRFAGKHPDAVVIECMAVQPQYQWIAEHKMVRSNIGVITNVRPDHIEEMGPRLEDIARSMGNTIPRQGKLVTAEKEMLDPLLEQAEKLGTEVDLVKPDDEIRRYLNKFPYLEHDENIAIALRVCQMAGVERKTALDGMIHAKPDPGALVLWNLDFDGKLTRFLSAFAANDPQSTLKIWRLIRDRMDGRGTTVFLNTRHDRRQRTRQLIQLVYEHIRPHTLIIRGENLPSQLKNFNKNNSRTRLITFPYSAKPSDVIAAIRKIHDQFLFGIGNMVGWGDDFVSELKRYRIDG